MKSKKQVIDEARTSGVKVHFASLMDICHLKNAELEAKHQKYKSRVVLRGDIVKDDSGSYAMIEGRVGRRGRRKRRNKGQTRDKQRGKREHRAKTQKKKKKRCSTGTNKRK